MENIIKTCKTSSDVTIIPSELLQHITWNTSYSLSSDHLSITTTNNTKIKFKLVQYRNYYTNYHKVNWEKFTQGIEGTISKSCNSTNVHVANKIITNVIL